MFQQGRFEIVPIEKWLEDPYYVGEDGLLLYPYWKEQMIDIFRPKVVPYTEVVITGSLGGGKSTCALYIMVRKLYELSCFENVATKFGLMSSASIVFYLLFGSKSTGFIDWVWTI